MADDINNSSTSQNENTQQNQQGSYSGTNQYNYGYSQNQYNQNYGYNQSNPYGQSGYSNNGYDYSQGSYGYSYAQGAYGQSAYDYGYQSAYDPNYASAYGQQALGGSETSSNPISVSPNTPFTSNNKIDLHLDGNIERNNDNRNLREDTYIKGLKGFLSYTYQYQVPIQIYINNGNLESFIAKGVVSSINKTTVSINDRIISLKSISFLTFKVDPASFDLSLSSTFSEGVNINNNDKNNQDDIYTFLYSKKAFNQYVAIGIDVLFAPELSQLIFISLNKDFVILKSIDIYYLIPIHKITFIE